MSLDLNDLISAQESNGFLSRSQVDWLHRSVQANLDAIPMVSSPQVADHISCDVTDLPQGSLWFEVEAALLDAQEPIRAGQQTWLQATRKVMVDHGLL